MKYFRWICAALALLAALSAYHFMNRDDGEPAAPIRTIGSSTMYTEDEINAVMDIVERHFDAKFEGCHLAELIYDEEESNLYCEDWARQYKADRAIVLLSSFDVDPSGADVGLNPNSTYVDWQWILTQKDGEGWILQTWGYG